MGIPIVSTPIGVDGIDITPDTEVMVRDLETMPETVIELLQNTSKQTQLAKAGRHLIEQHYSWEHVVTMYETLYQVITSRGY